MPSYYEILGIGADASAEEIQAAYDKLLSQCYAELGSRATHDAAIKKIKQINEARNVLVSSDRQRYDDDTRQEAEIKALPPNPSRRFLARCCDVLIFFVFYYPLYRYLADYVFFEDWALALEFAALGIALYIALETAFVYLAGTTLGKWMLSIAFTPIHGEELKRKQLVKRNLMASLYGLGLYVPPFCLVTMAIQYRKLIKGDDERRTSWDRASGIGVSYGDVKGVRLLFMVVVLVFVVIDIISLF